MQKRAKWVRRGATVLIVILCLPLALPALKADIVGVSSERSGDDSVCASALAVVWNRPRAGSSEDSASRMGGESRGPETWTIA